VIVYLDQNYASRMAKHLLGQPGHEAFGRLFLALKGRALAPPSPFHVLETLYPARGPKEKAGYLLPALMEVFLWPGGDWETPADLSPFAGLLQGLPEDPLEARAWALEEIQRRTGLREVPFTRLLATLLAESRKDKSRKPRPSDLLDFVMAATVYPYVDRLLTDRYLRNLLGKKAVGGRRKEVEALLLSLKGE